MAHAADFAVPVAAPVDVAVAVAVAVTVAVPTGTFVAQMQPMKDMELTNSNTRTSNRMPARLNFLRWKATSHPSNKAGTKNMPASSRLSASLLTSETIPDEAPSVIICSWVVCTTLFPVAVSVGCKHACRITGKIVAGEGHHADKSAHRSKCCAVCPCAMVRAGLFTVMKKSGATAVKATLTLLPIVPLVLAK